MIAELALAIQTCVCNRLAAVGRPIACCCIGFERPAREGAYVLVAPLLVGPEEQDELLENCPVSSWVPRFTVVIGRCITDDTCNSTSSEAISFIDDVEEAMFAITCCALPGNLGNPAIFQVNFRTFENETGRIFNEAEILVDTRVPRPWGVPA